MTVYRTDSVNNTLSHENTQALVELQSKKQWVCWCFELDKNGRPTKVPYNAHNGYKASDTNPKHWSTYQTAIKAKRNADGKPYDGVGFVFNNDYTGIDCDHCIAPDGSIDQWALDILDQLGSFADKSPNDGIHIFVRAVLPPDSRHKFALKGKRHEKAAVEMYSLGRFFTVTGNHVEGTPETIEPHQAELDALHQELLAHIQKPPAEKSQKQSIHFNLSDRELIEKACKASNGTLFEALWRGDISTYPSQSEADQALCNLLAFWTGKDASRMDSLFRQSGLYREKWDRNARSGETYGDGTIREAIANCRETYEKQRQWTNYDPSQDSSSSNGNSNGHNNRARIITNNTQLRDITYETLTALRKKSASSERLYVHFSQLSRVVKDEDGRPIVQQMSIASLKGELSEAADFYRTRKDKEGNDIAFSVSPPNEVAEQILALPPSDWKFPSLKGVTEVPLVKPDGTLLDTPGYDKKLKVFYDPSEDLKGLKIPEYCTQEDAIKAAKVLLHLIAEFPFESDADKANMIGLILTPFIRHAFKGDIQLALLDATNPGTGKTFLAQIAAIIATGARTEARSQKGDDDEWRKFILAVLLKCPQIVLIDNVRGTLASVSLEAALTSETISDRLLGVSKDVSATNTAVWIATGNNLLIGGDLARRCFRIRLIANNANPDERDDYDIPEILDYCEEHRRELVTAILIMVKAWFQAEKPAAKAKIAKADSFGNWIKMVGGILEFADIQGWQKNREELRSKNNEEAKEWEYFLSAWSKRYGEAWKKTLEVQKDIIEGCPNSYIADADSHLFEALPNILAEKFAKNKDSFYLSLGKALSFRKQTVYGLQGFQIESKEDTHAGGTLWRVTSKNGPENKPPQTPPESKTQNGSTSGSNESTESTAEVCRGSTPLATEKISASKLEESDKALFCESPDRQGGQTSANIRAGQNGHAQKEALDGSTSAINTVLEQPPESPVCGGSFSKAEFDGLLSEYRELFRQVGQSREKLAPLGTLMWYVPDSNLETGQVSVSEYRRRLSFLSASEDMRKIQAGIEEMQRKLGSIQ